MKQNRLTDIENRLLVAKTEVRWGRDGLWNLELVDAIYYIYRTDKQQGPTI